MSDSLKAARYVAKLTDPREVRFHVSLEEMGDSLVALARRDPVKAQSIRELGKVIAVCIAEKMSGYDVTIRTATESEAKEVMG